MFIVKGSDAERIPIGRIGENNARRIQFYVGDILNEFPNATFTFLNKRPGDFDAYPVNPENYTVEDRYLLWTVTSGDLTNDGTGMCQIVARENDSTVKTHTYMTAIGKALDGSAEPPEPWESWTVQIVEAAMTVNTAYDAWTNMVAEAETLDPGTPAYARYEDGTLYIGVPRGETSADQFIDDEAGAGDTDKTWSADKLTEEFGRVQTNVIDDEAGAGDTNKTWSADKLTEELGHVQTEVIDDEAGEGDTDKTWSANKLVEELGNIPHVDFNDPVFTGSVSMGRNGDRGELSTALGNNATASGAYSHAEGDRSKAMALSSHAEGTQTRATGGSSHAEGYGAPYMDGQTQITPGATGHASHSEGYQTIASGANAHAEGNRTVASGNEGAHAEGGGTRATGSYSHAEGFNDSSTNGARGTADHIEGYNTDASSGENGYGAHAEGNNTNAYSNGAHAEGNNTYASGNASHAEGFTTRADGNYSHSEGYFTIATGSMSHTEGGYSEATGAYAHAEGHDTTSSGGNGAHAEGHSSTASGDGSHAEGFMTASQGRYSHAEGSHSTASGDYSHAEGKNTVIDEFAEAAHAEGDGATAYGPASHAEGTNTVARGGSSHAQGVDTVAEDVPGGIPQFAFGRKNVPIMPKVVTVGPNVATEWEENKPVLAWSKIFKVTENGETTYYIPHNNVPAFPEPLADTAHAWWEPYELPEGTDPSTIFVWRRNAVYSVGSIVREKANDGEWYYFTNPHTAVLTTNVPLTTIAYYHTQAAGTETQLYETPAIEIVGNSLDGINPSNARMLDAYGNEYLAGDVYVHCNPDGTGGEKLGGGSQTDNPVFTGSISMGREDVYDVGYNSVAVGSNVRATASSSHAEGYNTAATGSASHAEGASTTASGKNSHAEGASTTASGMYSHAEGENTTASGQNSHAGGANSSATGPWSFAHGQRLTASGYDAVAFGLRNTASGDYSFAIGRSSEANGDDSFAGGSGSIADGRESFAFGAGVYAANAGYIPQHAFGFLNYKMGPRQVTVGPDVAETWEPFKPVAAYGKIFKSGSYYYVPHIDVPARPEPIYDAPHQWWEEYELPSGTDPATINEWDPESYYSTGDIVKEQYIDGEYGYFRCKTNVTTLYVPLSAGYYYHTENPGATVGLYEFPVIEVIGNARCPNEHLRSNARVLDKWGNEYLAGDVYVHCGHDSSGGNKLEGLPAYSAANNGQVLQIVNGVPTWVSISSATGVNF